MKRPCLLTTFVSGYNFQAFIPLLVFSCKKAYPEYDIMIFLNGHLLDSVHKILMDNSLLENVTFVENYIEQKEISTLQAASYRWTIWDEKFKNYEYIYIVDVDMFYIREPIPLHIQHADRLKKTGLPFDNIIRYTKVKRSKFSILRRLKYAGLHKFLSFVTQKVVIEPRLSGLLFIKVDGFYDEQSLDYLRQIRERIGKRYFFPEILSSNDEALLFRIMEDLGYNCMVLGKQSDNVKSLDFNNHLREEFRPHHGIHLGMFKNARISELPYRLRNSFESILNSEPYEFYINNYKKIICSSEFKRFRESLTQDITIYLERLNDYYGI